MSKLTKCLRHLTDEKKPQPWVNGIEDRPRGKCVILKTSRAPLCCAWARGGLQANVHLSSPRVLTLNEAGEISEPTALRRPEPDAPHKGRAINIHGWARWWPGERLAGAGLAVDRKDRSSSGTALRPGSWLQLTKSNCFLASCLPSL